MAAPGMVFAVGMNSFNQVAPPSAAGSKSNQRSFATPRAVGLSLPEDEGELIQVEAGERASYALTSAGTVYEWGYNHGMHLPHPRPRALGLPLQVRRLAAGAKHCLALLEGGYIASWGCGYFGQLGHREELSSHEPRLVERLKPEMLADRVVKVAAGAYHSGAITSQGRLIMWGLNRDGQCAQGHNQNTAAPEFTRLNDPVREISLGRNHTACIATEAHSLEDRVYCWGAAGFGRLGVHTSSKYTAVPKLVTYFRHDALADVRCGAYHTLALTRDGSVHAWGYGAEGQCGQGNTLHLRTPRVVEALRRRGAKVVSIAAGNWWSAAVTAEGDLYTWGYGDGGWLASPPPNPAEVPYVEPGPPLPPATPGGLPSDRGTCDTVAFDSKHNALQPVKAPALGGGYLANEVR
mmetsp:Transcript_39205/g.122671  ORF Transcript_39205/g.122671 Transcript_39205/m.122671 type:complete len:407 (-) Transcript_39205:271-1491(-)